MQCPECKSENLRRARRRGIKESILYRVVLLAPFRCRKCGFRRYRSSLKGGSKVRSGKQTVARFLGIPRKSRRKFQRNAMAIGIGAFLFLMAVYVLHQLAD